MAFGPRSGYMNPGASFGRCTILTERPAISGHPFDPHPTETNAVQIGRKHSYGTGLRELSRTVITNRCRCLRRHPLDRGHHPPSSSRGLGFVRRPAETRPEADPLLVQTPRAAGRADDDGPGSPTTTTPERMTTKTTTTIMDNGCAATHCTHASAQVLSAKMLTPYLNGIRSY